MCVVSTLLSSSQGFILVYDITNLESFHNIYFWMNEIGVSVCDYVEVAWVGEESYSPGHKGVVKNIVGLLW